MTKLLVATTNQKKLKELQALLAELPIELVNLSSFPEVQEVEENGDSFEANATLKAVGYSKQTGLLTLGEDSGLCVDALDGGPGIYSARFAGEGKSDADNNAKLLRLMEKMPGMCRGAHYHSSIVIADGDNVLTHASGQVYGMIEHELKGTGGFGYDPLFFYPEFGKTFGEVAPEKKQSVSHRAQALSKIKAFLENYLLEKK